MREGQPSKTALGVARGLVFAAADPTLGPLCPPRAGDYAEKILGAQSRTQAIELKLLSQTWYRALGRVHERIWVRGVFCTSRCASGSSTTACAPHSRTAPSSWS
ncbi:MAG: hypothetical protein IPH13_09165 [Planctomycetes bacterium]|nr:hypothetical protein [Planctomycetota bacterium]